MSGLLDKLITNGSLLSKNGQTPSINIGATKESILHANGNQPGYSLTGADANLVKDYLNTYDDGVNNIPPQPSQLDLEGKLPPKYIDNLPS